MNCGNRTMAARAKAYRNLGAVIGISVVAALAAAPVAARPAADSIYVNGVVLPMTAPDARAAALAVRKGRIAAIGSTAEIDRWRGKGTRVVDLGGKTLLPGFIDAHGHIAMVAQWSGMANLAPPPVGPGTDIAALQAAMRDHAKTQPEGWLVGIGYDDSLLAERRHPTRQELDEISTERPILLIHASGHLIALNTKALAEAGLLHAAAATSAADDMVHRDADGTATGVVEESAAFKVVMALPQASLAEGIRRLGVAQEIYAKNGITTAQDGLTTPDNWKILQEADRQKTLFLDINALPFIESPAAWLNSLPFDGAYHGRLRVAGVKMIVDGSPQGRTAWLSQPYYRVPQGRASDYAGYGKYSDQQLLAYLRQAAAAGWQVYAHTNGDAAIQQLIDGVAAINQGGGAQLHRTISIHAQTARLDQLQQMKELDIQPSFFAAHTFYWGDWHREVTLGPVRADRISPQRDAFDVGLRPTIHNDSPVVPPDIIHALWSATTRRTRSDDILGPEQRVTPYEALLEVTANAAYELREEKDKGTLEPGKVADLVILSANPLATDPEKLRSLKVVQTIKDGAPVYELAAPAAVADGGAD